MGAALADSASFGYAGDHVWTSPETRRRHYMFGFARARPWWLYQVRLAVGSTRARLSFRHSTLRTITRRPAATVSLLRAQEIKERAGETYEQPGEQHILQDHQRSARRFSRRGHVVDLPGGDRRKSNDHHPGIFGSLFGQCQPPGVLARGETSRFGGRVPCAPRDLRRAQTSSY